MNEQPLDLNDAKTLSLADVENVTSNGKSRRSKNSAPKKTEKKRRMYLKSWTNLRGYEMFYGGKAAPCPVCSINEFRYLGNSNGNSKGFLIFSRSTDHYWNYVCTDCRTIRQIYYSSLYSAWHRGKWTFKAISN